MNLLKDARDVILATACVQVMRYVWASERGRNQGAWREIAPRRPAPRPSLDRSSIVPPPAG